MICDSAWKCKTTGIVKWEQQTIQMTCYSRVYFLKVPQNTRHKTKYGDCTRRTCVEWCQLNICSSGIPCPQLGAKISQEIVPWMCEFRMQVNRILCNNLFNFTMWLVLLTPQGWYAFPGSKEMMNFIVSSIREMKTWDAICKIKSIIAKETECLFI